LLDLIYKQITDTKAKLNVIRFTNLFKVTVYWKEHLTRMAKNKMPGGSWQYDPR